MPYREESTIRRVNLDNRVTIPRSICEKLGLLPGTEVEFKLIGDGIDMIKKCPTLKKRLGKATNEQLTGKDTSR